MRLVQVTVEREERDWETERLREREVIKTLKYLEAIRAKKISFNHWSFTRGSMNAMSFAGRHFSYSMNTSLTNVSVSDTV